MEKMIRWLVEKFMPEHHLKLKPKRTGKPKMPRGKKSAQENPSEKLAEV